MTCQNMDMQGIEGSGQFNDFTVSFKSSMSLSMLNHCCILECRGKMGGYCKGNLSKDGDWYIMLCALRRFVFICWNAMSAGTMK